MRRNAFGLFLSNLRPYRIVKEEERNFNKSSSQLNENATKLLRFVYFTNESNTLKLILEIKQPSDFQFEKVDLGHHRGFNYSFFSSFSSDPPNEHCVRLWPCVKGWISHKQTELVANGGCPWGWPVRISAALIRKFVSMCLWECEQPLRGPAGYICVRRCLRYPLFLKKKKPFAQYEAACRVNEENKFKFFSDVWNISIVTVFNRFLEYVWHYNVFCNIMLDLYSA